MIQSMTGYGKAETVLETGKLTVEIRTLNSKSADINIKSSLLPKDRELEVRSRIAECLQRGTIDVYLSWEPNTTEGGRQINTDIATAYMEQARSIFETSGRRVQDCPEAYATLLGAVLRMPEIYEIKKQEVITEDNWDAVSAAIDKALAKVCEYREKEGAVLLADVTGRVHKILDLYNQVEAFEPERIDAVRSRILRALDELSQKPDASRFEQEMIFYLEKYDINEEKVRLRQHCRYFLDTLESDPYPGKKLGFIVQEMGREINTTGSKANHAGIQRCVVMMKDELEKIREQSMNIL